MLIGQQLTDIINTMEDEPLIELKINERGMRAVHGAVCYTLEKWSGQEEIDQEQLMALKPFFQGCVFEFDFGKMMGD